MPQKQRQDQIIQILKTEGFVTVRHLVKTLHYSSATINRDLNAMQDLKIVKRSYGGVELLSRKDNLPPLPMREFYQAPEKRKIAEAASKLVLDGDCIFLSGSTTTQCMVPFLATKKNLTVITNSLRIAIELGEFDIMVICLGGMVTERPFITQSDLTVDNAMRYHADKMFFSTNLFTEDGVINYAGHLLYRVMMKNSKKVYYLTDESKLTDRVWHSLCDFSSIDGVISNFDFPQKTKEKYPNADFISINT